MRHPRLPTSFTLPIARLLALLLALAFLPPAATPVHAIGTSIVVNPGVGDADNNGDGACSLYEALQAIALQAQYNQCNAAGGPPYAITFSASGPLNLTSVLTNLPEVSRFVTITGPMTIVGRGTGADPIFQVSNGGTLNLANLTLTQGAPAVRVRTGGTLNAAAVMFTGNNSDLDGGAIQSEGAVNIAGSTFSGNSAGGSDGGGAIWALGSQTLAVAGTVFSGNTATRSGGAIYAVAPAVLTDVVFNGNIALADDPNNNGANDPGDNYDALGAGAVYARNTGLPGDELVITRGVFNGNLTVRGNGGALHVAPNAVARISDSSFNGNLAGSSGNDRRGGAIANFGGATTIIRSTLLNNGVTGSGGAIANSGTLGLTLANVSLIANLASQQGGGLHNVDAGNPSNQPPVTLRNVTISLNRAGAGGGIFNQSNGIITPANTIVHGSDSDGGNCAGGPITSQGNNLDSGGSCSFIQPGDQQNADPQLGAPAFHGGPISSLLIQKPGGGSAAIDAGNPAVCADALVAGVDMRGFSRPKGAVCDIGSFEADAPAAGASSTPLPPGPISFGNVQIGSSQDATFSVSNSGNAALTLSNPLISGPDAADFALLTAFPLAVAAPATITLRCAPAGGAPGVRSATLSYATNDPQRPLVSFALACNAVAQAVAGFASTPAAPGPLDFGKVQTGAFLDRAITVQESGDATLTVATPAFGGANPGDFSVVSGLPLALGNNSAPASIMIRCTPAAPGIRTATLTLATNDPTRPAVTYALSCTGRTPPAPPLASAAVSQASAGDGPFAVAVSPDGRHVYVTAQTSGNVFAFRRAANGTLSLVNSQALAGARFVTVSSDGRNVYASSGSGNSLTAYTRNLDTGAITALHTVTQGEQYGCILPSVCAGTVDGLNNAQGVVVSPDGRHVYVAGAGSAAVVVLRRSAADGGIRGSGGPSFIQRFQAPTTTELAGVRNVVVSNDGRNLYAAGYDNDRLVTIERDAVTGGLVHVQTLADNQLLGGLPLQILDGLDGVFSAAISPDDLQVYAVGQQDNAIVTFRRNLADRGRLSYAGRLANGNGAGGLGGTIGVAVDPLGRYVYATGDTDDTLAVFARDPDGSLEFVQIVNRATPGPLLDGARGVAVAPDGQAVFVAAFGDDTLVALGPPNPAPAAESLMPASVTAGSDTLTFTVNGTGFTPATRVRWTDSTGTLEQSAVFVSSSKVRATIGASRLASAGTATIRIVNPAPGGGTSNGLTFTITAPATNPVPSVDELVPAGAPAGGSVTTIIVKGAGFIQGSTVRWNGAARVTTYISPTTLQAVLPATDLAQPGAAAVTVVNPAPGGGASNALAFDVTAPGANPPPALTSLSPSGILAGANGSLNVVVTGSGFVEGAQARWNGVARPTQFINQGMLQISLSGADLVTSGNNSVDVVNPAPGGGTSNALAFVVAAPGENLTPSVTGVTAITFHTNGTRTVTIAGSGFVNGALVQWNGAQLTPVAISSNTLQVTVAAADLEQPAVIAVVNPAPGGGPSNEFLYRMPRINIPLVVR